MLDNHRHIHFIGMGGSGVSALVHMALAHKLKVGGSDVADSSLLQALRREGAEVFVGHKKDNLSPLAELVVYSEAIDKKSNPEYLAAKESNVPMMSYFEALGRVSEHKKTIVVTGTHGKTTTTAMLGQALLAAGRDPLVIVGSQVPAFGGQNVHLGKDEWLIAEACEYRRSFIYFQPFGMVLLNCEPDHLDYYTDEADYRSAFTELAEKIPKEGFLVYNADDRNAALVAERCQGKKIAVTKKDADGLGLNLKVPGKFNQMNAAHAYFAAMEASDNRAKVREGLENFTGTSRRMEIKGEREGILFMDDYAHHPTEINATLGALREKYAGRRLICVFQPHQHSRTHRLLNDFTRAFGDANRVIVPNIFAARDTEEDKAKISAESFVEALKRAGVNATYGNGLEGTMALLKREAKSGDIIVTMGAGDVYKISEAL